MDSNQVTAPIVVICYNRKDKLKVCIDSLMKCELSDKTEVFIFSDGAKNKDDEIKVGEVREYINSLKTTHTFKNLTVIPRENNYGLARSVIGGVSEIINIYGKAIVVEDDLLLSRDFLRYMNSALDYYKDKKRYGLISAYTYPLKVLSNYDKDIYVAGKGECWGWGTWKDRWDNVDWELSSFEEYLKDPARRKAFSSLEIGLEDQLIAQYEGRLDAWAARWCFHLFNNDLWTVYPKICRAVNIGFDGTGSNCDASELFDAKINEEEFECVFEDLVRDPKFDKAIYDFGKPKGLGIGIKLLRIINTLKRIGKKGD